MFELKSEKTGKVLNCPTSIEEIDFAYLQEVSKDFIIKNESMVLIALLAEVPLKEIANNKDVSIKAKSLIVKFPENYNKEVGFGQLGIYHTNRKIIYESRNQSISISFPKNELDMKTIQSMILEDIKLKNEIIDGKTFKSVSSGAAIAAVKGSHNFGTGGINLRLSAYENIISILFKLVPSFSLIGEEINDYLSYTPDKVTTYSSKLNYLDRN